MLHIAISRQRIGIIYLALVLVDGEGIIGNCQFCRVHRVIARLTGCMDISVDSRKRESAHGCVVIDRYFCVFRVAQTRGNCYGEGQKHGYRIELLFHQFFVNFEIRMQIYAQFRKNVSFSPYN